MGTTSISSPTAPVGPGSAVVQLPGMPNTSQSLGVGEATDGRVAARSWACPCSLTLSPSTRDKVIKTVLTALVACVIISAIAPVLVGIEIQRVHNSFLLAFRLPQTRAYGIAVPLWLAPSTAVDITLACVLLWELHIPATERSLRFKALHERIALFVRIVMQSGIVLAALQLGVLIGWHRQLALNDPLKWSSWIYVPQAILAKVYTMTLLVIVTMPHTKTVRQHTPELYIAPLSPAAAGLHSYNRNNLIGSGTYGQQYLPRFRSPASPASPNQHQYRHSLQDSRYPDAKKFQLGKPPLSEHAAKRASAAALPHLVASRAPQQPYHHRRAESQRARGRGSVTVQGAEQDMADPVARSYSHEANPFAVRAEQDDLPYVRQSSTLHSPRSISTNNIATTSTHSVSVGEDKKFGRDGSHLEPASSSRSCYAEEDTDRFQVSFAVDADTSNSTTKGVDDDEAASDAHLTVSDRAHTRLADYVYYSPPLSGAFCVPPSIPLTCAAPGATASDVSAMPAAPPSAHHRSTERDAHAIERLEASGRYDRRPSSTLVDHDWVGEASMEQEAMSTPGQRGDTYEMTAYCSKARDEAVREPRQRTKTAGTGVASNERSSPSQPRFAGLLMQSLHRLRPGLRSTTSVRSDNSVSAFENEVAIQTGLSTYRFGTDHSESPAALTAQAGTVGARDPAVDPAQAPAYTITEDQSADGNPGLRASAQADSNSALLGLYQQNLAGPRSQLQPSPFSSTESLHAFGTGGTGATASQVGRPFWPRAQLLSSVSEGLEQTCVDVWHGDDEEDKRSTKAQNGGNE